MKAVRSLVFNIFLFPWTLLAAIFLCLLLPFPRIFVIKGIRFWAATIYGALKLIVGLDYRVLGGQNIVPGPVIFACKHQSAWDTGIFTLLIDKPSYVVKQELWRIPFYGAVIRKIGTIAVNRSMGPSAIKGMVRDARRLLEEGHQVVIFPEGTRTTPGKKSEYLPGIAALYKLTKVPVVPVALNSGLFWGRRTFIKHPGTITIEFLEPIPPGLESREFLELMQSRIETAASRLIAEAEH